MAIAPVPFRILTVYAHPDDESFGPAAILARYVRTEGAEVYGVFATRGEHGDPTLEPAPSPAEMARLREQDLRDATLGEIGYRDIAFLDYEDGTLEAVTEEELQAHVLAAIRTHQPNVVITFGPAGITHHPDHVAIHRATLAAFHVGRATGIAPLNGLFYDAVPPTRAADMGIADDPDGRPNTYVPLDAADFAAKLCALEAHARHVKDAAERVAALRAAVQRDAPPPGTLFRAWPELADGEVVSSLV